MKLEHAIVDLIVSAGLLVVLGVVVALLWINARRAREQARALAALREEMRLRRVVERSMRTGLVMIDNAGAITYVNPAFCSMTGWSREDLVGQQRPYSYWAPEEHEWLGKLIAQELKGCIRPAGTEQQIVRKDGSVFEARMYVSLLTDDNGNSNGCIASVTDISEPKKMERQLTATRERFITVLEALGASVSVAHIGSSELLFSNQLYHQWFGDSTAGHLQLLHGDTAPMISSDDSTDDVDGFAGLPLGDLTSSAALQPREVHMASLGKWLEVHTRYLNWADGRLVQMVIASDITTRHEAKQRLALQAERMEAVNRLVTMGEMASSIAHELNQPLTAISNYCLGIIGRLQDDRLSREELLQALDKTARQAQRAGRIIRHIRAFVQRNVARSQRVDVLQLVQQVVELAQIDLGRRCIGFHWQRPHSLPVVRADAILIQQVLMNLIKNAAEAIDAAPGHPRHIELEVRAREIDGTQAVEFAVIDSGGGLTPEEEARLFEPFFSTKGQGMGIGLSLCRSIVEAHQGKITTRNLYNRGGTIEGCRFAFWIPTGKTVDSDNLEHHARPAGSSNTR